MNGSAGSAAAADGSVDDAGAATGAWDLVTGDTSMGANPEASKAVEKAVDGMTGADYDPVALLGTQAVAGTNYCVLCRVTPVAPDAEPTYDLVYVYEDLDGKCELVDNVELDVAGGYDYGKAAQGDSDVDADEDDGAALGASAPDGSAD